MKHANGLLLGLGLVLAVSGLGCGKGVGAPPPDAGGGGPTDAGTDAAVLPDAGPDAGMDAGADAGVDAGGLDAGPLPDAGTAVCPASSPNVDQMAGPCCFLASNAGDLANAAFRVSGVLITAPPSLTSPIIRGALQGYLDQELFNWVIELQGATMDGPITVETGYGQLNASDNSFSFCETGVGAPCEPARWPPVTANGTLTGESFVAGLFPAAVRLPIFDAADPSTTTLELPLRDLRFTMADMSIARSCIGLRTGGSYDTSKGSLTTYITVVSARAGHVEIGSAINTSLCGLVAGMPTSDGSDPCGTTAQSAWNVKPDSLCNAGGCTQDPGDKSVCDPASSCNAWQLAAGFAAQGVAVR